MGARAPSPQTIWRRESNTSHGSFQERSSTTTSICAVYPAPRSTQLGHEMPDLYPWTGWKQANAMVTMGECMGTKSIKAHVSLKSA